MRVRVWVKGWSRVSFVFGACSRTKSQCRRCVPGTLYGACPKKTFALTAGILSFHHDVHLQTAFQCRCFPSTCVCYNSGGCNKMRDYALACVYHSERIFP